MEAVFGVLGFFRNSESLGEFVTELLMENWGNLRELSGRVCFSQNLGRLAGILVCGMIAQSVSTGQFLWCVLIRVSLRMTESLCEN